MGKLQQTWHNQIQQKCWLDLDEQLEREQQELCEQGLGEQPSLGQVKKCEQHWGEQLTRKGWPRKYGLGLGELEAVAWN